MSEAFPFIAGGAVQAGGGVYLERDADRDLLQHCRAGDFTYVLTSRQMGKSSLMYRAAERLADGDARPIIIDLTELGAQTTADQWYKGFLVRVQEQLDLRAGASDWWDAHANYAYAHRVIRYLREVALVERPERLVLFVDEIDTTLRLDFTDDFFAAIRFLYQNRAMDPELNRISFVLIGVAMPNDLIKDAARTPFNIGHRIELTDFTRAEALALTHHLPVPPDSGADVIGWILRWTGGQPYLTMRVLRSLTESSPAEWTASAVDDRTRDLFFGPKGESDTNLQFVRDMLTRNAFDREAVLATYDRIRGGGRVADQELDQVASVLKLSGIVRRQDGLLRVRNAIYEHVFDQRWTRVHRRLHVNWRRRLTRVAAALLVVTVLATIPLAVYAFRQKAIADTARHQAERDRDLAESRRGETETQLLTTERNLETAREAVKALEQFAPKEAQRLNAELGTAGQEAAQAVASLTAERERLRRERDEAVQTSQKVSKENAALRQDLQRLQQSAAAASNPGPAAASKSAPEPSVSVPNLVGLRLADAENQIRALGLLLDTRLVESGSPRGTIIEQTPRSNTSVKPGAVVLMDVSSGPRVAPSAPPPSPAGQAAAPADDALLQIVRVLQRYKAGYEALDAKAVAAVYPSTNISGLQAAFSDLSKLTYDAKLHLDGIVVSPDGQSATVTATETIRFVPKIGSAPLKNGVVTFTMRKVGGGWTIQSVK